MPYAKSYRIFPFLKFVCFRNMNYVYAKVKVYLDVPISWTPDETNISSCRWITHSISHVALFKHLSELYMIGILLSDFEDPHPFVHVGARALLECVEVRNIHFVSSGRHEGPRRL